MAAPLAAPAAPTYVRPVPRPAALVLLVALGCGASAEEARFRQALGQAPPMVNPALARAVDAAASSSWDSTYRMLSYSAAEACFLAEWNVPPHLAESLEFRLEGWRSLDEDRSAVPSVRSRSVELLDRAAVARIKANDPPIADEVPAEVRALAPPLTPMRVCFAPTVIRADTRYLVISVEYDERHRTGAGWRLVAPRRAGR